MIQRKQSFWLFIAALLNAGVFYFDLYRYTVHAAANGADATKDSPGHITVAGQFPLLLVAIIMTLLPLVSIFLFKKRRRQIGLAVVSILACVSFISLLLMYVAHLSNSLNGSYWIGSVLPVISIVFLFLAISGIARDEKLVKSVDRLR